MKIPKCKEEEGKISIEYLLRKDPNLLLNNYTAAMLIADKLEDLLIKKGSSTSTTRSCRTAWSEG